MSNMIEIYLSIFIGGEQFPQTKRKKAQTKSFINLCCKCLYLFDKKNHMI